MNNFILIGKIANGSGIVDELDKQKTMILAVQNVNDTTTEYIPVSVNDFQNETIEMFKNETTVAVRGRIAVIDFKIKLIAEKIAILSKGENNE